jgi:hypothetical protein
MTHHAVPTTSRIQKRQNLSKQTNNTISMAPTTRSRSRQTPLNPMEGIWNILKQRVRRRIWNSLKALKEVLQDEWSKITQEICARIPEMPERCKSLVKQVEHPLRAHCGDVE